jgi:hypothetical protein
LADISIEVSPAEGIGLSPEATRTADYVDKKRLAGDRLWPLYRYRPGRGS